MLGHNQIKSRKWILLGVSLVGITALFIVLVSIILSDNPKNTQTNSGNNSLTQQSVTATQVSIPLTSQVTTSNLSQSNTVLNGSLDLSYTGKNVVTLSEKDFWPSGKPANMQNVKLGLFTTTDNWQLVRSFYTQKLQKVGFTLSGRDPCNFNDCKTAAFFDGVLTPSKDHPDLADPYDINFVIIDANAGENEFTESGIPTSLREKMKPNTTLIAYAARSLDYYGNTPSSNSTVTPKTTQR